VMEVSPFHRSKMWPVDVVSLGGGPLGHPKIYINLVSSLLHSKTSDPTIIFEQDKPGPKPCGLVLLCFWGTVLKSPTCNTCLIDTGKTANLPCLADMLNHNRSGIRFEQDPHHGHGAH
jgi:hypothetical protein